MSRRSRRHPRTFAFERIDRACHHCGLPIKPGTYYTPIYGHVYHTPCWDELWQRGGGR